MDIFFGLNVKHLRKTRNIEREQLAERFNLHLSSISHWERGKHLPKVEDVVRLAQFFDVSIDDLLLTDMGREASTVNEKSEPYYSTGERNSREIEALYEKFNNLEKRVKALEEGEENNSPDIR